MTKYLAAALLATVLFTGTASAQTTSTKTAVPDSAATTHKEGQWRASKLVGVNVYNEANEKIGDISDVILDKSGKVENVVLGVGGFLGMGEHYVADVIGGVVYAIIAIAIVRMLLARFPRRAFGT